MKADSISLGTPEVHSFFEPITHTVTHVIVDPATKKCAILDSVMDFEPNSARVSFQSADRVVEYIKANEWEVEWLLESHVHADHLSAAPYIQSILGGQLAIGAPIKEVQKTFGEVFNLDTEFDLSVGKFDRLFKGGDQFQIGGIEATVIHTPGHTPADMTYHIGDAAFVGDTLFMPDFGTARCDFPGGSASRLYESIQKIFELPGETRLFMCHDYLPEGRNEFEWETTVDKEKRENIHVGESKSESSFIEMREKRDAQLGMPRLIVPAIQVNIRGGRLPESEENDTIYLKVPINKF